MRFRGIAVVICLGAAVAVGTARAEEKPLFELGIAGGGGYLPDYPAADENHVNGIALPYIVYRGKFLRAGDKGLVRGRLIHRKDVEFDVSLSGSFKADSDNNDARRGMPDLDYLVEIGPRLQWTVARAAKWAKIDLELPVRAVFSADFVEVDYRGVRFAPQIAYQHERFLGLPLELKLGLGADFATEKLHDYFYQVPTQFVTASRPAFDADGGYLGSRLQLLLKYRVGSRLTLLGGGLVSFHGGAANEDSPLFRDDVNYGVGLGLVYSFYQSTRTVDE